MRYLFSIFLVAILIFSCSPTKDTLNVSGTERELFNEKGQDTVKIASENPDDEWEIIIIDPGFNTWLRSIARPRAYYSQNFMEIRNQIWVTTWNQRVIQPARFDPNLYMLQIDYRPDIDYGYEVNYQLYNYLVYFQRKYNQRLGGPLPRI